MREGCRVAGDAKVDVSIAIRELKRGRRVRRRAWPSGSYLVMEGEGQGRTISRVATLDGKAARTVQWLFGMPEILALDWETMED